MGSGNRASAGRFEPACWVDLETGGVLPVEELEWFRSPSVTEVRAGAQVSLSRQFGLPAVGIPEFDRASCAGRFAGEDLIFLTDGSNASGGYFLPAAFKGQGVIVTTGGYVGEDMAMGRARGGATVTGSGWAPLAEAIEVFSEGLIPFEHEFVGFEREVETQIEMLGAYRKDRETLHLEDPVETDLFLDVWSDSPGTEGYVYEHVLRAVDAHEGSGRERR